ncbi:AT-rich interactive domain-containing protein 4A [Fasciola gigantica]|uniref:AT-rich interactive domain-containing protein 4A n=1 Tax=Fasciola gigantica TaxID=46835 RepID=A0A504Z0P6_FASGI|nr:AT-rich interactive domain-containing protein 4A [Fasciola gigantica]
MTKPTTGDATSDTSTVDQVVNRDSIFLTAGTAVSAKYRGAFCEATVDEVDLSFRLKVQLLNTTKDVISVDQSGLVSGTPLPNSEVTVRIPSSDVRPTNAATAFVERLGTVLRATDTSLYTVVFDDGDKRTLRRTQLVIKGERHFKESEVSAKFVSTWITAYRMCRKAHSSAGAKHRAAECYWFQSSSSLLIGSVERSLKSVSCSIFLVSIMSLDCLPLTNPEQFRQPVIDRRKHRSGNEDTDDETVENSSLGDGDEHRSHVAEENETTNRAVGSLPNISLVPLSACDQFSDVSDDNKQTDASTLTTATASAVHNTTAASMNATTSTTINITADGIGTSTAGESGLLKTVTTDEQDRYALVELAQQAAYARLLGRLVLVNMPIRSKDHSMNTTPSSSVNAGDIPARRRFGPCLVVLPSAMPSIDLRSGYRLPQLLVRSFKDNRYFGAPLCYLKRLKRPAAVEMAHTYPSLRTAFERALLWLDRYELPVNWGENATQTLLGAKNWRAYKREQRVALADAPRQIKSVSVKSCKARRIRSSSPYSSVSSADEVNGTPVTAGVQSSTPIKRGRTTSSPANTRKMTTSRKRPRQSDAARTRPSEASPRKKMRLKLLASKTTISRSPDARRRSLRPNSPRKLLTGLQRKCSSRAIRTQSRVSSNVKSVTKKDADSDYSGEGHRSRSASSQSPCALSSVTGANATTTEPQAGLLYSPVSDGSSESSISSSSTSTCSTTSSSSSDTESTSSSSSSSISSSLSSSTTSTLSSSSSSTTSSTNFEARDRWIAQLYRFMDEGGTPINKAPCLANKDLDLYKLYRLVKELGGFHRVTAQMKWGYIYSKLHLPQHFTAGPRNLQAAFKRYLYPLDDVSRKLGTDLDELPLARPRHQTLANQNAAQAAKSGTGQAHSTGTSSRQPAAPTGLSSTPNVGHKTVGQQPKSTDKSATPAPVVVPRTTTPASTTTTNTTTNNTPACVTAGPISPNSKEFSPPKVVGIEPIVESTSFSSPPVLSPLMASHECSPSPETTTLTTKGGSKRDGSGPIPMESMELGDDLPRNLFETRVDEKSRESETARTRSFADAWKSSSSLLELSLTEGTQVNRIIPIGSRVRVRCGDRVAYEAKVLNHIRPQPEFCTRNTDQNNATSATGAAGGAGAAASSASARVKWSASSEMQYRVHYMGWNRRHDEVVSRSRIISVIKWARPVDSLRPPSCSSLNLVVQEPRSKMWASSRSTGKLRRTVGTDRSTGSLMRTRGGRLGDSGGSCTRSASTSVRVRRHMRNPSASLDAKDREGEGASDEDEDLEDEENDHEGDDEEEDEDEEEQDPEAESDQSQTTETASDIVTTMAPIVRRRRMMFGKVLTPNRRHTRIRTEVSTPTCSPSGVSTRSETGSTKRSATRDSMIEHSVPTSSSHCGVTLERMKPEIGGSGSRSEIHESGAPYSKRARLVSQSMEKHALPTDLMDSGQTKTTPIAENSTTVAVGNSAKSTIGSIKLEPDTDVEAGKSTTHNKRTDSVTQDEQPRSGTQNKRKNAPSVVPTTTVSSVPNLSVVAGPVSGSTGSVAKKMGSVNSAPEKVDRPGLKRPLSYGARRISLIKGDKLRSLKRTVPGVGDTSIGHRRVVPLRKGSMGSTSASAVVEISLTVSATADDVSKGVTKSKKKAVASEPPAVKAIDPVRATRPTVPERIRGASTEGVKPVPSITASSSKAVNTPSSDEKPIPVIVQQHSASPTPSSKSSKIESIRKATTSKSGSDEKDSAIRQSIKPRLGKSTTENKVSVPQNKSKLSKSETTGAGNPKGGTVSRANPTKRVAGSRATQTPLSRTNRTRKQSICSSSSSDSSDSSGSSRSGISISLPTKKSQKSSAPSKEKSSIVATDTGVRRGRDPRRSVVVKRSRPIQAVSDAVGRSASSSSSKSRSSTKRTNNRGNGRNGRSSSSSTSSSSSSSEYGNMDALPRLTRSQHRQLLGDTPPGAALQTAAPVGAVTSGTTENTSMIIPASIKPEPPSKENASKSSVKPELSSKENASKSSVKSEMEMEGPGLDDVDKNRPIEEDKSHSGSKPSSTTVSPNQTTVCTIPSTVNKAITTPVIATITTITNSPTDLVDVVSGASISPSITPQLELDNSATKSCDSPEVTHEGSVINLPSPKSAVKPRGRSKSVRCSTSGISTTDKPRERTGGINSARSETVVKNVSPLEDSHLLVVEQNKPQKIEDVEEKEPPKTSKEREDEETTADEEDEQSSVHTVSTDPMKGVLFDLTMSPDAVTPIRSSSSDSVSAGSRVASASSSDSETEGKSAHCPTMTIMTTTSTPVGVRTDREKHTANSVYRQSARETQCDKAAMVVDDEEDEDEVKGEASTDTDAEEDEEEEDDNTSAPSTTGGSKRSVKLQKRSEVASRGSVEPETEGKLPRAEQEPITHKASARRRQVSVCSSSTENASATGASRKGLKRAQGTPQRSMAFDRSPTPNSDSPHYSHSPAHSSSASGNMACASGTPVGNRLSQTQPAPSQLPGPRLLASQRRFGGPFFPIHGLDEMHTEAKCQILQDRMHQIVEAWRLAKQYLKDLDQRTNRTRRLRARTTGPDNQNTGPGTPGPKLSSANPTTNVSVTAANAGLGSNTDQHRIVAPI